MPVYVPDCQLCCDTPCVHNLAHCLIGLVTFVEQGIGLAV
jgi:hypothetical protein